MSKKHTTKDQRIAAEKAALRQRVEDIVRGAFEWRYDPEFFTDTNYVLSGECDAVTFGRFLLGMQAAFPIMQDEHRMGAHFQDPSRFHIWDRPWPEVIDKLYEGGLRA